MTTTPTAVPTTTAVAGGIGTSPLRPDGIPKVRGEFAFSGDLHEEGMLWGATVRSPHARARILSIDPAPALAIPGVHAVLTQDDVPGRKTCGQAVKDQPVLADGETRFWGEPVAVVAADDAETAARAAAAVAVRYEPLDALTDPGEAERQGSVFRTMHVVNGDPDRRGEVVVEGYYETGTIDQAMLGTEAGLAVPDGEGGVDLYVATQWIHEDHEQLYASLGVEPGAARIHLSGIGGAFGAREDLTLQIHLCMLALHTGRPVKMVLDRAESFAAHVHRHPSRMWYRHEADPDGTLVRVEAKLIFDGGAYQTTSHAVIANGAYFAMGPYHCESVDVVGIATRTNNPPNGAMRGFGAVQVCFAYEAQMDKLAAALGMDPIDLRLRNALDAGDRLPTTGQVIEGAFPVAEVIRSLAAMPLPDAGPGGDPRHLPGGAGLTTTAADIRRGVGFAVGFKNIAFAESFDDYAEARVTLTPDGLLVETAAAEVGQGMVTVLQQIARTATGIEQVEVAFVDTAAIGSAGSTSASRQTQMTGGAVLEAAEAVRDEALRRAGGGTLSGEGVLRDGVVVATLADVLAEGPITELVRFRHPPTTAPSETGQGDLHAGFSVAAHRAVVDVDPDLGLVRVVQVDTAQDVGKALHPAALVGQLEGGILQGVGMAVMEELRIDDGVVRNASFTDYLLPTILDAPDVEAVLIEEPDHWGPFGAKGVGEPPTISSTAAVVAAIRDATGRDLTRAPVRPEDVAGV
ncbi:MAG: molybdopterin-dependent oxidoreductase [Actinobacteria bacterium]|nr:molybdopterin-dependent oxidoreductase [Actinomycetota bacterium]